MSSYNHLGCSCCGGPFNGENCPSCSSVGSGNEFVYDPNPYSYNETPNFFNQPPHYSPSQPQTYSCELCGNDAHYGYDCPPQVPFISNPDPCYNQDFDNFPQTSPNFQQQYLCCENCGGPHETFQCQPMNQNFYNSNSSGFDQFQPPQYFDVHQPPEKISIEELKIMMLSYCEIKCQRHEHEAILLQEQAVEEKQELLAEEQAANPSEPSLVSYFYNADCDNISTPSTTYTIHLTKSTTIITNPSEPTRRIYHNHDIFYDGDDDEELFPDEVKRIQQILERTSFDAITPDFLITDSLSMGDEHLSTILETELDELIKSSIENLIPTPSEFEDLSKDLSDIEDPHHFNAESDLIESLLNRDTLIISSPKFDSLLEEFFEFNYEYSDAIIKSFSPSPILVEDSDSLMEEIDLFLTPDDSMPPGIENDDYDSEGDIIFLEELLSNDSPSLPENESFHFDVPSSPRPPAKPPDDDEIEPDTGVLTAKVVGDISEHYVLMPRLLPTQPTLCPVIDTLLPFSSENEDKVHLLSHWGLKAFQLFSESPMMIYGGNIPTLDVLITLDYEDSRARGFVHRSLNLQSMLLGIRCH
ncbi:hypothetical protein Tco_1132876 [Tanacetum coccineum]|uniref:CCHC-type domain-containing protein n=1 Tax=Tanacetum coccineum TaxID=301880 RepID=A0ABQ5JEI6_9ASTR